MEMMHKVTPAMIKEVAIKEVNRESFGAAKREKKLVRKQDRMR